MRVKGIGITLGAVLASSLFFSNSVSAASDIFVSNSGKVSFGKVQPTSAGVLATGEDTLDITTDCEAGVNVYATSTNGGSTSLVNLAANSNNTITTSSNTISSPSSLENNTWGLNVINNNTYYGLPEYSASGLPTVIYSGTNTELPIYYGAKVTNSLAPGTYTGEVLYTVTVNNSCLDYTVKFDKNASSASGDMSDQAILPTGGTLSENSFTYSGYTFLGWSLDPAGKTGTATNGIGTAEDVDFEDKASFPGSNESILPGSEVTLYAIWEKEIIYMQNWFGCAKMQPNEIVTLTDSRDNRDYKVKKLPDGKCWMVQNLALGMNATSAGLTLTPANTNIDNGTTYYLPPAGKQGSGTIDQNSTLTSTSTANFTNDATNDQHAKTQFKAKNSGISNDSDTGYYNFYTVTLGYDYHGSRTSGSSTRDICPAGWRLPWTTDSGSSSTGKGDFYTLGLSYDNSSSAWYSYITPGTSSTNTPYSANSTVRQNMIFGDAGSLNPVLANSAIGFNYAGYYNNTGLYGVGANGNYWSSSVADGNGVHLLYLDASYVYTKMYGSKYIGNTVRCVAKYSNVSGYMQDFDTDSLAPGESTTLLDKRDNQEYTVYRIPTDATYPGTSDAANVAGKVIMTKDLNLGAKDSVTGSASTIVANGAMTLSPEDSTFTAPTGSGESITVPTTNVSITNGTRNWGYSDSSTNTYNNKRYTTSGTGDYANRGYYSWGAAMTVCPKGWRLPSRDEYNDSSSWEGATIGISRLVKGDSTTQSITNITSPSWLFALGGYYSGSFVNAGTFGGYWSSTQGTTAARNLVLDSSSGLKIGDYNKYVGLAVRCIAEYQYTINYNANGGTGEMSPSEGYIGSTISKIAFTKDGYYFLGWSTNSSATTATYSDGATISTDLAPTGSSVTLYAVWSSTPPDCSSTFHPTDTTPCKMADGRLWIFGNDNNSITWSEMFTNGNGVNNHDATVRPGICPSGYSAPKITDFDTLIRAYGGTSYSSNRNGYRDTTGAIQSIIPSRVYWSSTELNSGNAYGLYATHSGGPNSSSYDSKNNNYYVMCYKSI